VQQQNKGRRQSSHDEDSSGFFAELGLELVGDMVPDSLVGWIILILVLLFVAAMRSAMNE
jgi:hypothetical protein